MVGPIVSYDSQPQRTLDINVQACGGIYSGVGHVDVEDDSLNSGIDWA